MIVVKKISYLFICLSIILAGVRPAFAQEPADPFLGKEFFYGAKVVAVNGDIVECQNGLFADVSTAKNQRLIEVGDKLNAIGEMVADPNYQTLIKAEITSVTKLRDVELDGAIQTVNGDEITILNQRVKVGPNVRLFGVNKLEPGQGAYVYAESLADGFHAFDIYAGNAPEHVDLGINSAITSIDGLKVSLMGGFTVNISEDNLKAFKLNDMGVNSIALVNLRQVPKSKKLKSPYVGEFQINLNLGGELQAVDPAESTITVINQKVPITDFTIISDGTGGRLNLSEIDPAKVARAQVSIHKIGGKPVTAFVSVFMKR
jgi:hypothetical protein